jgi:hypothetical protein
MVTDDVGTTVSGSADLTSMDHAPALCAHPTAKSQSAAQSVTAALKAARTALIFAWVNETATVLTPRVGEASADAGFLSCSASTVASKRSSSQS